MRSIDDLVELNVEQLELLLIHNCSKKNDFSQYNDFLDTLEVYSNTGLGLKYYYNVRSDDYTIVPFIKKIGFV